ncbi:procollagen-lysine,2-oxoglutarate 5-dioxygenase isoform X2 [Phymastichus coffea]|uniref:procollagen-lysine,2-oxoglutarate 5-dioxygenase isoform X2 n=1 Tax=Phymastichus coffea TaxID=108790 RepID=UPI00273CC78F|nr:procollagen-lysine,2-oxoglutarate 5-dioxygenase isoform X2 [Phymastichus coffea]
MLAISVLLLAACSLAAGCDADRDGKSVADDLTQYSCSRDLKLGSYVSRNNKNSSCEQVHDRGPPRTARKPKDHSQCYCTLDDRQEAIVLTVATNETDGFRRFMRSSAVYGFRERVQVLGLGEDWRGGDVSRFAGGGQKVNLLRRALEPLRERPDTVILFTDSYDVIFLAPLDRIVRKFKDWPGSPRLLFSAEEACWPDASLAADYPEVARGKRFLNSGGFIGYVDAVGEVLRAASIDDADDDQLFYTRTFLHAETRRRLGIQLDHRSEIFQNLQGAVYDIELRFKGNEAYVQNTAYNSVPMVLHGNGPSKLLLNSLGNYVAEAWSPEEGCLECWEGAVELDPAEPLAYPRLLVALFVERPTPFLEEFLEKVQRQRYPKSRLHLFVHNAVPEHEALVQAFADRAAEQYRGVKRIRPEDGVAEAEARSLAVRHCLALGCSGYLSVDSEAHLDNADTLELLVEQQRGVLAPLLVRPYKAWSNFWGAITDDGYYARSTDYMQIIHNERRGLWNVPFVSSCYLVNASLLGNEATRPSYLEADLDPDMAFAHANRRRDIFMYASNRLDFGHLVSLDQFNVSLTNPEVYQLFDNRLDWEARYIHPEYAASLEPGHRPLQPCPDVYWFPIVTPRFAREFVEIMEAYGQWSDGSNYDPRLENGYEAVPTRDIHMTQVGLDHHWLEFLRLYVNPLQRLAFHGYYDYPPRSLMNFVVRYKPTEQASLKPHHDSSTYTINIALNQVGVDYEGGGCHFIRYNCSVTDTKPGWMLVHPGRLTHYHEGLVVTKGTRYIMISFVDP